MDQIENNTIISTSDSRPISPSQITMTTEVVPAMVEEETKLEDSSLNEKKEKPKKCNIKRKSTKVPEGQEESFQKRSIKKQKGGQSSSFGGGDFTAHMLTIKAGEDIIEAIMSFTEKSSRGTCILSANGAVCNVKIQPLGFNDRVLMYKGEYEITSLKGTMVITESEGVRNEIGGWQIVIAGGGCLYGGSLSGSLIAASSVQVVLGSFCPSMMTDNESESVIVAPIPDASGSEDKGQASQAQQPEMDLTPNLILL